MPAKRVAMMNMKGGVGKSTLTVNIAWELAGVWGRDNNVLVVDLDPQFNASQYMLGTSEYRTRIVDDKHPTIWDVFEQKTRTPGQASRPPLSPRDVIVSVATWATNHLDLLPSSLDLAWSLRQPGGKEVLLKQFLDLVKDDYHLILIDCPPTESVLTSAAYHAADQVVVPVKPEFLSTIGLPLLARSIADHNAEPGAPQVAVSGVIFNHASNYLPEEETAKGEVSRLALRHGWRLFQNAVPYSRSFPRGAREGKPLRQTSYARRKSKRVLAAATDEFARAVGL